MRYVFRDGHFRDPNTGERMPLPAGNDVCCPMVRSDIEPYASPIDGRMITTRSERRYDLESNGCIEADPPKKKRGYVNERFAKKRGLKINEETQEKFNAARKKKADMRREAESLNANGTK